MSIHRWKQVSRRSGIRDSDLQGERHNSQTEGETGKKMLKQPGGNSSYTQSTRRD
jgi:hypothetical protein